MTTWPAGGYRNGESAQDHDDWMEFRVEFFFDFDFNQVEMRFPGKGTMS